MRPVSGLTLQTPRKAMDSLQQVHQMRIQAQTSPERQAEPTVDQR